MPPFLNYFEMSPSLWEEALRMHSTGEHRLVSVQCLWGAHEQTKGICDLVRSPKLRLEKLLSLAKTNKMKVNLCFGFPPHFLSFPNWTQGENRKGFVPAVFWDSQDCAYRFYPIPSFVSSEFQGGFIDFLGEILDIAALYNGENGIINEVTIDFGVLASDLALATTQDYLELFQKKYTTVETLNRLFSTSYRLIPVGSPELLFRTLYERRPWLTAFDYRSFREELLNRFKTKIQKFVSGTSLRSQVKFQGDFQGFMETPEKLLIMDGTFFDLKKERVVPFFPEKAANTMSAYAFRIAGYCQSFAQQEHFNFRRVCEQKIPHNFLAPFTLAVFGKQMSSNAIELLKNFSSGGGHVFFPFGFPLYDESNCEIQWNEYGSKSILKNTKKPMAKIAIGRGGVFSPIGRLPIDQNLAHLFTEYENIIKGTHQC